MADFQAIGGVSATLQTLLQDRMDFPPDLLPVGQPVAVTVDAPPVYEPDDGAAPAELPQVNLFLYRVTENGFLKNQEIPGHGGTAFGAPPLSLELFYLLTAYGRSTEGPDVGDSKLAQYLLGSAMRVFHDFPVITESLARHAAPVIGDPVLDTRLFGEFEQLRLCPHPISLDDLTKVWTALVQPYRLSAAYVVSATQIESRRPRRFPRPVGEPPAAGPRITAVTLARPEITELRAIRGGIEHPYPYARIGDTLVVLGHGFIGTSIRLEMGSVEIPLKPKSATRIEAKVPDDVLEDLTPVAPDARLQPGAHAVRVRIGVDAMPHVAFDSNEAVFMLVPSITTPVAIDPPTSDPRLLHVQGLRLWHERLPGQTVIGRSVISASTYSAASSTQIDVPLPDGLPRSPAACLFGGDVSAFAGTAGSTELEIRIGGGAFHTLSLAPMADLEAAARLLGVAIRAVTDAGTAYTNARVTVARGAADAHLVIMPGGLRAPVTVQEHLLDTLATDLRLTGAAGAVTADTYLSGELAPFPKLTVASPRLRVTIDGVVRTVPLAVRPSTLADAATSLQAAIRNAAAGDVNFAATYVAVLGSQLLIVPPNGLPTQVEPVPAVDTTSARELQLRAEYLVRVRVNGAESLDDAVITLP